MTSYRRISSRTLNRDIQQQDNMVTFMKPISQAIYPNYFSVPDASTNSLLVSTGSPYSATASAKLIFDGTTLDVSGDIVAHGTIKANQFLPGQVANVSMLSYVSTDLSQNPVTVTTTSTIFSYSYTPKSATSYIICEYQTIYRVNGNGTDSAEAYLYVKENESDPDIRISSTYQQWTGTTIDTTGTGTRSGTMLPIVGRYRNTNLNPKIIRVDVFTSTDTITVQGDNSTWLKITEIGR